MSALPILRNTYTTFADATVDAHVLTLPSATAPIAYNNGTGVISLTGMVPTANGGIVTISVNTTFYVDPVLGTDDMAHGLAAGASAWKTAQFAVNVVSGYVILSGVVASIQLADATYATTLLLKPFLGGGLIGILGNIATPSNVSFTANPSITTSTTSLNDLGGGVFNYQVTSVQAKRIDAINNSVINVSGIVCPTNTGSQTRAHLRAAGGGLIIIQTSYAITGGAKNHLLCESGGKIIFNQITGTITGTPAFSLAFAQASGGGFMRVSGSPTGAVTWSGAATGIRYAVSTNGIIDASISSTSDTYLPGNVAGTSVTGGRYFGSGDSGPIVHRAGTATAGTAPIKFTPGVLLTVPELGALEFTDDLVNSHLYITINIAGVLTRWQLV